MNVISLQSGSNGNSIYVEAGGMKLLFDAGISGKQAQLRLADHGRDIRNVDALIISHDHSDHARCAGIYHRKFGVPVYITSRTLQSVSDRYSLGAMEDVRFFEAGQTLQFAGVRVSTIPTPHDAADGVVFVVDDGSRRLGILTDLGFVFRELAETIASLDAVLLESNYDPGMLAGSPYPPFLKSRISGRGGHLSNGESAELLRSAAPRRMKWACLGHLSHENNCPKLAIETHRGILGRSLPLHVAGRYCATDVMVV